MRRVRIEKTIVPCVANSETAWHVLHGWIWDVWRGDERIAVVYATRLCGEGSIIHFEVVESAVCGWLDLLSSLRVFMPYIVRFGVVFATVPKVRKLVDVLKRFGFLVVEGGGWMRDGEEILLLKYEKAVK